MHRITFRPITPRDKKKEKAMFAHISKESQRHRFFTRVKDIDRHLHNHYKHFDYEKDVGVVAEETTGRTKHIIGIAHLFVDPDSPKAEFSILVADPWQHQGVGSKLMDYVLEVAKSRNMNTIYAYLLPDNQSMATMMHSRGFELKLQDDLVYGQLDVR